MTNNSTDFGFFTVAVDNNNVSLSFSLDGEKVDNFEIFESKTIDSVSVGAEDLSELANFKL